MKQKILDLITGLEFEHKSCEKLWHKTNVSNRGGIKGQPQLIAYKSRMDTLSMCIKKLKEAVHE